MIAVPAESLDDFQANTATEAYPDEDDDGRQDVLLSRGQIATTNPGFTADEIEAAYRGVLEPEEVVASPHDVDAPSNVTLTAEEPMITDGTLREVLAELSSGNGVPLDADSRSDPRDCYPNSTTRHVAFAWWLPADHANEIQTDSVTFDLGFYTEQCRHNDGSGMDPEES